MRFVYGAALALGRCTLHSADEVPRRRWALGRARISCSNADGDPTGLDTRRIEGRPWLRDGRLEQAAIASLTAPQPAFTAALLRALSRSVRQIRALLRAADLTPLFATAQEVA